MKHATGYRMDHDDRVTCIIPTSSLCASATAGPSGGGRARILACSVAAFLLPLWCSANAAEGEIFTPSAYTTTRYDSNSFRLSEDTSLNVSNQGSLVTRTFGVGLRVVKSYGLQNVVLEGNVTRYMYSTFSSLDATGHDVSGVYNWKLTPSIAGAVVYKSSAVPSDFADTGFRTTSNIRTTTEKRLDTDWLAGAALHPRISLFEVTSDSDQPVFQLENSRTRYASASLIYLFPSNNSVEAYAQRGNGSYQNLLPDPVTQLATQFREQQAGTRVHWVFNGLSRMDADLGYLDRTHEDLPTRDFAGFVGNLTLSYLLTGKTKFDIYLARQLYSSQSTLSSYAQEERATVFATYAATSNISVVPSFLFLKRVFKAPPIPIPIELRELTRVYSLELRWTPLRQLDLSASVGHETRGATLTSLQYSNRTGQVNARLHF